MVRIPVILGSVRHGRRSERVARFLVGKLEEHPEVETELLDLLEYDFPIFRERLRYLDDPPADLVDFAERVDRGDALVIVSPEYNKSYPAALKNALDALGPEVKDKPIGIASVSVGAFGGLVVVQALRITMLNLGAVPVPGYFPVPHADENFDADGTPTDPKYHERADRLVTELVEFAEALR